MSLLQALILGIVQGITEFLPISSDGHLVLVESVLGLETKELKGFDVVLHLGTLLATLFYFRKDVLNILQRDYKLGGYIVLATIPAVIVGLTLEDQIDGIFRDPKVVMAMLLVMAGFFFIAEKFPREKNRTKFTLSNTFIIGIAQATALLPGISRSGTTIGTALLHGIKREEAARFSFLLGMPAIAGAVLLKGIHIVEGRTVLPEWDAVLVGFLASAIAGYLSVNFLMKFLKNHTLNVFGVYLVIVSVAGLLFLNA